MKVTSILMLDSGGMLPKWGFTLQTYPINRPPASLSPFLASFLAGAAFVSFLASFFPPFPSC